ncbi:MAG: rRNA maturation RNase YbeY [Bacteroidota bacterium]
MRRFKINFFIEEISFNLKNKNKIKSLLKQVNYNNKQLSGEINYILCPDEYLLNINKEYLNHNTYTDIITFENYDNSGELMADIYISIDRVIENSKKFSTSFSDEIIRVISHGFLHICGFKDKTKKESETMRVKENECIALYNSLL